MKLYLKYLLPLLPASSLGDLCAGNDASFNWYGRSGHPPYFLRNAEKCPQTYALSRCEQSAVMMDGTASFATDESGAEACTLDVDYWATKQNCNDTLACSDLVALKDELMAGGHNIVCRHEKTFWQQHTGEVENCHASGNCLAEAKPTQRQLQPYGWKAADVFATAFAKMGIPIDKAFTSGFTRCAQHADLFVEGKAEERLELLYVGSPKEVLALNNITGGRPEALRWQSFSLRNFAGKRPAAGKNNIMVTHGFNMKLGFGTAVDEGYCMVMKPRDDLPSLAESVGSLAVGNWTFEYDDDAFPVDAVARMSPESASLMQTCDDVRSRAMDGGGEGDVLSSMDEDHDMRITREEFLSRFGPAGNGRDAFDFIRSVLIQPGALGKPEGPRPAIELGQFYHVNWGWREGSVTGGDISYPWRAILENTIGPVGLPTPGERVAAFGRANGVLAGLVSELGDGEKYPTAAAMEEKLSGCDKGGVPGGVDGEAADAFLGGSGGPEDVETGRMQNGTHGDANASTGTQVVYRILN